MEKRLAACLPVTVLIVVLLFAFFLVPVASGTSSVNVPLDHWAYGALDKLDGFGLIHSDLPGTRPYTRMEIGRLVKEALVERANSGKSFPPLLDYFFQKFQEEFKEEIDAWDPGRSQPARSYLKPVEEARMRYVFSDGDPRTFTKFPDTKYTMNATEGTPLVYNNDGIIYGQGSNMSLQMSSSMRLFDVVSGYIEPVFIVRQNGGTDANLDQVEAEVLRGYGKLTVWNLELEAGKDSMWWGQGRHGELLMTNNAEPLNMIKLSNPTPAILPWYFSYLGPSKFTIFAGQLDDFYVNLAPPKSSVQELELTHVGLSGLRFDIKPHPLFEMAFSTAFLFGGNGRPNFSFGDYVSTLFGFFGRSASEAAKTDQLASLDFRIQLPWLKNAVLYGEYAGEDSGGLEYPEEFLFGDVGWLVGLYFPAITDDGRTDLRIEYANDAHRKDSTPGVWYGHWAYASGYTNQMMFIGHHMGGGCTGRVRAGESLPEGRPGFRYRLRLHGTRFDPQSHTRDDPSGRLRLHL